MVEDIVYRLSCESECVTWDYEQLHKQARLAEDADSRRSVFRRDAERSFDPLQVLIVTVPSMYFCH